MRTEDAVGQRQIAERWSQVMVAVAEGQATGGELHRLAAEFDRVSPGLADSAFTGVTALACESHRYVHGYPCTPQETATRAHMDALPASVSRTDRHVAAAFVRAWFETNAHGNMLSARRIVAVFKALSPARRVAGTAVAAGYAAAQVAGLPATARAVLALTCRYAPTIESPFAHVYGAVLADAARAGQPLLALETVAAVKGCGGPVWQEIVWVSLRTAAAFVVPGAAVPVPPSGWCDCDDGQRAAELMSGWAAQVGAGKAGMREFVHMQVGQYITREVSVAEHMLDSAAVLLAATTSLKTA